VKRDKRSKDAAGAESPPGLLAGGEHGKLTSPGGEEWPVRVTRGEGDVLMLVLLVEDERPAPEQVGSLTLECTSKHGLARFQGEAVLEDRDLVRFNIRDSAEVEQRREFVRVQSPQPVILSVTGSDTIDNAYSVDLSGGGMLLNGPEALRLEDNIRFRLHLDANHEPIKGRARVVRCAGDGQRAIVFEQISRRDRDRLIHFIFDRQREARAKTRGLTD
jgi:PilZ domain